MTTEQKLKKGISVFNPNNLPIEKFGKCDYENHYQITHDPNLKCKTRLMMVYTDEYISGCSEEEEYIPNSELYCCVECAEAFSDW